MTIEAASVGLNCGPPFKARNGTPSSVNVTITGEMLVTAELWITEV
jgi:hypothetical protein